MITLELTRAGGGVLPAWEPGAHVELEPIAGLTRQYSLCGDPADRERWRIAILRDTHSRGGSSYIHDNLVVGDRVQSSGPHNRFPLLRASRYRFIAGGIGITPILPMIRAVVASRAEWTLVYGGRSRASMAFLDELEEYADHVVIQPEDEQGLLDLSKLLSGPGDDELIYCCGPQALLDAVDQRTTAWPAGALHTERFTAPSGSDGNASKAFEVELAVSDRTLTVPPGRSILEVVREEGVQVLSSCEEGTCGTCETTVLAGEIDHRDAVLSREERAANDTMMICVSRAVSPSLVLDL
ncbi:PDR/VanB family oxidoreductase [Amycolatopsis japonica]